MPRKPKVEFFEGFSFQKTKKKGRTTVISFNWPSSWREKRWGFRSYEKTVMGGRKRPYSKTIELNDEQDADKIAKKLLKIRRRKKNGS